MIYLSIRHLQKLLSLLQVFLENPPPPSEALSSTLASMATTCTLFLDFTELSVTTAAWNVLALIMNIDFDVILSMMDQFNSRLQHGTPEFLFIVVTTNFKLRKGVEFVKKWLELLQLAGAQESVLQHPNLITLYNPCWHILI